jgi:hypothetical protein
MNATKSRPRVKPTRHVRVLLPVFGKNPGVIRIAVGGKATDYLVEPIGSDFGDGFRLTKLDGWGDVYHVNLSNEGHICDCKGHLKHGHCKHPAALAALRQADRL